MLQVYLRRSADAYALLADALALSGLSPLPTIARTPAGKPLFPALPQLHFNLSHTQGWSLCALSDRPVGVDIERIRPRREGLFSYCLTDEERRRFDGSWSEFYRLWTLKEAWCKYAGQPLGSPKAWPTPPPCPHRSYLVDGCAAAVCGEEAPPVRLLLL